MSDPIKFWATVAKIQTLSDSGLRFTLDAPESAIMAAAELMACKRMGVVVDVVVTVRPAEQVDTGEQTRDVATRPKRKPKWATEEKSSADDDLGNGGE